MEIEHSGMVLYLTAIQALRCLGREVKKQSEHAGLSASFSSCLSCPSMFLSPQRNETWIDRRESRKGKEAA
jgi:hypothetical protein